jgi:hypothetical protein
MALKIGTEWIMNYGSDAPRLYNTRTQAESFTTTLRASMTSTTVSTAFNRGDGTAKDADFETSGEVVEQADMVYFSGHGSMDGPVFPKSTSTGGDAAALPIEIRWGDKSPGVRWIVLDCCWALQTLSTATPPGIDTLGRWATAFAGVRHILGFGTASSDETLRGQKLAAYLAYGYSMRVAWRKACEETEEVTRRYALIRKGGCYYDTIGTANAAAATADLNYEWGYC